jgi:hypothetical protein
MEILPFAASAFPPVCANAGDPAAQINKANTSAFLFLIIRPRLNAANAAESRAILYDALAGGQKNPLKPTRSAALTRARSSGHDACRSTRAP